MSVGTSHPMFVSLPPSVPHSFLFFDASPFPSVKVRFLLQGFMVLLMSLLYSSQSVLSGSTNLQVSAKGDLFVKMILSSLNVLVILHVSSWTFCHVFVKTCTIYPH